jgi:hypothetical protein
VYTLFTELVNGFKAATMLNITLRSAYWTLVVFFLGASGLVASDIDNRVERKASHTYVVSSAHK